jgi:chemotaxis protein methyltransferase CheR
LARLVEEVSGNVVPPAHLPFLARAAAERVHATGQCDLAAYVAALARGALAGEWSALLPLVTVNESYFFRTPQHFAALVSGMLPPVLAARAATRTLRVWSAGCARGEEPGTLAIALAELPALAGWEWRILATDVDEEALAAARRGRYGERAVATAPPELRARHFARDGGEHVLADALRAHIDYRVLNLVREPLDPPGAPFDVVFMRNVLIYFRPASQRRVVAAVAASLAADGVLFVGPAETLWQLSDALVPVDLGDCFCYRKAEAGSEEQEAGSGVRGPGSGVGGQGLGIGGQGSGVRDRGAGKREEEAASSARGGSEAAPAPPGTRERLAEAVRRLAANRLAETAALLDEAVAADPADPEAHALEGYVHDLSGRSELAIASFRAALYLDPRLFQARLLLADALRRLGWEERAGAEYRAVLLLLAAGDATALAALAGLPLPDRAAAECRARAALTAGG